MGAPFTAAEKKLWLLWILAVAGGTGLSLVLVDLGMNQLAFIGENETLLTLFLVALPVPSILIQWWALRPHIDQAWWWIPASLSGALAPTLSVIAQWLLLRRRVQRAFWWPLLYFLLNFLSQLYVDLLGRQILALLLLWTVNGAISGWLMVILLRQPWQPGDGNEFNQMIKAMEAKQKTRDDG